MYILCFLKDEGRNIDKLYKYLTDNLKEITENNIYTKINYYYDIQSMCPRRQVLHT